MTPPFRIRPTLALLAAVVFGILLAPFFPFSPWLSYGTAFACLMAGLVLHTRHERYARVAIALFLFAFVFLSLGRARQIMIPAPDDISRWAERPSLWIYGAVVSDVDQRERGASAFTLAVSTVDNFRGRYPASGQIRVFLRNAPMPETGDVLWLRGRVETPPEATNPGAFDYRKYLACQGVFSLVHVRQGGDIHRTGTVATALYPLVKALRVGVRRGSAQLIPTHTGLMNGLVLSDRNGLSVDVENAFERTGTVHLLSVSGTHLSALAAFLILIFGILLAPRPLSSAFSIAYLWLFVLASGSSPAALRSAVMASVVLAGPLLRRAPQMPGALIFAAFVLLLLFPGDLYDIGFQFSFAAIGVLCFYALPLSHLLLRRRANDSVWDVVFNRVTMAILVGVIFFLGTAPLCAYYFNILAPIGIVANCLLIPLAELLTLLGLTIGITLSAGAFIVAGIHYLFPLFTFPTLPWLDVLCVPLSRFLDWLAWFFLFLAHSFAALPGAAFSIASPPPALVLIYYAALGIIAPFFRRYALRKTLFDPTPVSAGGANASSAAGMPNGKP